MYKVTFSGIDGSGKSTSIDVISSTLAESGLVLIHPYRPAFADLAKKGRIYFSNKLNRVTDYCHDKADDHRIKNLVGLINVIYSRVATSIERNAIKKYNPDLILLGRDPVLDPLAYSSYYFPFTQDMSIEEKVRITLSINQASTANLLFYMDIDPEVAYDRILKRIEREKRDGAKDRAKWVHMHENPEELQFLKYQFEQALPFLEKKLGINIIRIDASKPQGEVIKEMLINIQELMHGNN